MVRTVRQSRHPLATSFLFARVSAKIIIINKIASLYATSLTGCNSFSFFGQWLVMKLMMVHTNTLNLSFGTF